jgi:hypothetical protein
MCNLFHEQNRHNNNALFGALFMDFHFSDLQFSENLVPPLMMLVNAGPRIQDVLRPNQKQLYTGNYSRKMTI